MGAPVLPQWAAIGQAVPSQQRMGWEGHTWRLARQPGREG